MSKLTILSKSESRFEDRAEAGLLLANELLEYKDKRTAVVGIPRGGVVVAGIISNKLNAELDVMVAHKIGAPMNPELAIGAVSEDGKCFLHKAIVSRFGIRQSYIDEEAQRQTKEIRRRIEDYRKVLPKLELEGRVVIVVDDGVATGATMEASLAITRREKPEKLIAALPVGAADTLKKLSGYCDELICLRAPLFFGSVGQFYFDFGQTSDEEVLDVLKKAGKRRAKT
jgi:putative phosphoribosyl transferase